MEMVRSGDGGPGVNSNVLVALRGIFFYLRASQVLAVVLRTRACSSGSWGQNVESSVGVGKELKTQDVSRLLASPVAGARTWLWRLSVDSNCP